MVFALPWNVPSLVSDPNFQKLHPLYVFMSFQKSAWSILSRARTKISHCRHSQTRERDGYGLAKEKALQMQ